MSKGLKISLIVVGVILLIGFMSFNWFRSGFDNVISMDENVKGKWAQVENQLKRRYDLIPNLVETVKGYASHEKELFENIDFGYYCTDLRGGQAKTDSQFQVGIQEAYEIVNGEVGSPVKDMSISGIAVDSLKLISGVGRHLDFEEGRCGKGQIAYFLDQMYSTRHEFQSRARLIYLHKLKKPHHHSS